MLLLHFTCREFPACSSNRTTAMVAYAKSTVNHITAKDKNLYRKQIILELR